MKKEEIKTENRGYDVCQYWCAFTFDNPLRRFFHKPEEMFKDYLKPGDKVMDLGCGMGYFSIGMARILGKNSTVYSVDLQDTMLNKVLKRANFYGLQDIIKINKNDANALNLNVKLDFALTFWMLHEVPDYKRCLQNIFDVLKEGGKLFIAEPRIHVKKRDFEDMLKIALDLGFMVDSTPKVRLSYAVVLKK